MTDVHLTKSIDTICVEIVNINGCDYVDITRQCLTGDSQPIRFLKGDEASACKFLSLLSGLMGVRDVIPNYREEKI